MAMLFVEGFDHFSDEGLKWDDGDLGGFVPTAGQGRFGGQSMKVSGAVLGVDINKVFPNSIATMVHGFAYKITNVDGDTMFDYKDSAGTVIGSLRNTAAGEVQFFVGGSAVITSSTGVILGNNWHYIEVKYVPKNSGGSVEVRVDEVSVGTFSGDTTNGLEDDISSWDMGSTDNNSDTYYDDIYVLDTTGTVNNDFLGDVRVLTVYPTNNATPNDFTAVGAASNYQAVDETPPIDLDTTYVENGSVGATDLYGIASTGLTGTIYGVQVSTCARKTDTELRRFKNVIKPSTSQTLSTDEHTLTASYKVYHDMFETNPDTGALWTIAEVEGNKFGFKLTV